MAGLVRDVLFEEGDAVKAGQKLAQLDTVQADFDLASAKALYAAATASIASIGADLQEAERVQERAAKLASTGYGAVANLTRDKAKTASLKAQYAKAIADRDAAQANLTYRSALLEQTSIVAPIFGIVINKQIHPGEMISPQVNGNGGARNTICTIIDRKSLEVSVDISESYIGRLSVGLPASVTLDAYPDQPISGSVIAIVPTASRDKATVKVRVSLNSENPLILPDMTAKVSFLEKFEDSASTLHE